MRVYVFVIVIVFVVKFQILVFIFFCKKNNFYLLQIGYVAHLAGAVAGLLVGLYVLRNLEEHSWEKKLKWIGLTLYIALMLIAIFFNIYQS